MFNEICYRVCAALLAVLLMLGLSSCATDTDAKRPVSAQAEQASAAKIGEALFIAPQPSSKSLVGAAAGSSCRTNNGGCPSCSITCPVGKSAMCYGGSVCYQTACACAQLPTCICQ